MIMRGNQLRPEVQADALRRFVHRYTKQHIPDWAQTYHPSILGRIAGRPSLPKTNYPVQFESDLDWLANTDFDVTADGRLDARCRACHSRPTWPDNPELRK